MQRVRPAAASDFDAIRQIATGSCDAPYSLETVLHEKLSGRGFRGSPQVIVSEAHGSISGFAVVAGNALRLITVRREDRRSGFGRLLQNEARSIAQRNGHDRLLIGWEAGNYFTPGVWKEDRGTQSFFESLNYQSEVEDAVNLEATLASLEMVKPEPSIRRAEPSARVATLDAVSRMFGKIWAFEIESCFDRPSPAIMIALNERNEIVGFSAHDANNRGLGSYGPAGVSKDLRGKGIGRALLIASLQDMKASGFTRVIIPWVSSSEFYRRGCGAKIAHQFIRYSTDSSQSV